MGYKFVERMENTLYNLKILKRIIAVMLVFIMTAGCIVVSDAESRNIEDALYTKTFECTTKGGTLYIKDSKGKVLKELKEGDKITYRYPSDKSPEDVYVEAVADKGYVVESYLAMWLLDCEKKDTCESVYNMQKKTYKRGHFLATAEYDEVFSVSFGKKTDDGLVDEDIPVYLSAKAAPDINNPKVGDTYSGNATITYNGKKTQFYNGTGYIICTSGDFKDEQITLNTCASGHDYWAPQTGQTGTYNITITSVNKKTGKITGKVEWANSKHTEGYQNLSGTFSYYHYFSGDFKLYKERGEVEGSYVTSGSLGNSDLSATFAVYSDKACTKKVTTIKTNALGSMTGSLTISAGTYYVKETAAPKGYAINPTVFTIKITNSSGKSLIVKDNILRAKIKGVKVDSQTGTSTPTLGLSLAGAVYGVYGDEQCKTERTRGTSDASGNIEFDKEYLAYGEYYIKEIKAPEGYYPDPAIHKIVVDESLGYYEGSTYRLNDVSFTSTEVPKKGKGFVNKKSLNESMSNGNSCYSLAGCKFQLRSAATNETVPEVLVTDETGKTQEIELAVGAYIVKEIEAPEGFELNQEEVMLEITENGTASVDFYDKPLNDPVGVLLKKTDAESGTEIATGAGELAGAEYTFKYYDGQYTTEQQLAGAVPARTWVLATDEEGIIYLKTAKKVSGDEFYTDENGVRTIPLGTVTIQETKAPEGYMKDDTLYIQNITADFSGTIIKSYQTPESAEPVIRGDIKGLKVSGGDKKRLANVPFKITSVANGESHVVVTDVNGILNTSASFNPHSRNTNRGETSKDGVWFGNLDELDDNRGALPYGAYMVEELPCKANKDKILIPPFEVAVTGNDQVVDLGTLVNEYIPVPKISTSATDKDTGKRNVYVSKKTTIIDEVSYIDLTKGEKYLIKGIVMDRKTGNPLLVNGKQVTAEKEFTAENSYGYISVDFTFNSSTLKGKSVVVFQSLYHDGRLVTVHADINNKKQTITFKNPKISTSATDKDTGERSAYVSKKSTIIDEVSHIDLTKGEKYLIRGVVMDKETKKPLLVNGKQVTAEKKFTAEKASGSVKMAFTFDSSALKGKEVVVFESLYYEGNEIAVHADINDKKQTITFKESPKKPSSPKTGDSVKVGVFVMLMVVFLACGMYLFYKNRKPDKEE